MQRWVPLLAVVLVAVAIAAAALVASRPSAVTATVTEWVTHTVRETVTALPVTFTVTERVTERMTVTATVTKTAASTGTAAEAPTPSLKIADVQVPWIVIARRLGSDAHLYVVISHEFPPGQRHDALVELWVGGQLADVEWVELRGTGSREVWLLASALTAPGIYVAEVRLHYHDGRRWVPVDSRTVSLPVSRLDVVDVECPSPTALPSSPITLQVAVTLEYDLPRSYVVFVGVPYDAVRYPDRWIAAWNGTLSGRGTYTVRLEFKPPLDPKWELRIDVFAVDPATRQRRYLPIMGLFPSPLTCGRIFQPTS